MLKNADPVDDAEDREITLNLLTAVSENQQLSQRLLASQLGIALGLANTYVKRCIRKGYIKVSQAPKRRYAYYLTPTGFAEKSRLTAEYLSFSFRFFRRAREEGEAIMAEYAEAGLGSVALWGASDLAEIMLICAQAKGLKVSAIVDPKAAPGTLLGVPVLPALQELPEGEIVILTDLAAPQASLDMLTAQLPPQRLRIPRILKVQAAPKLAPEDS